MLATARVTNGDGHNKFTRVFAVVGLDGDVYLSIRHDRCGGVQAMSLEAPPAPCMHDVIPRRVYHSRSPQISALPPAYAPHVPRWRTCQTSLYRRATQRDGSSEACERFA